MTRKLGIENMWTAFLQDTQFIFLRKVLTDKKRLRGTDHFRIAEPIKDEKIFTKRTSCALRNPSLLDHSINYSTILIDGVLANECVSSTIVGYLTERPNTNIILIKDATDFCPYETPLSYWECVTKRAKQPERFSIVETADIEKAFELELAAA